MSAPIPCEPRCCPEAQDINIPGPTGPQGTAGADGTDGVNAFTVLTSDATIPAIGGNVAANVANNTWAGVGQTVFLSDGVDKGTFTVVSVTGTTVMTLTFLGAPGDSAPGAIIGSGGTVSPGGTPQSTPLAVTAGGTAVAALTDRSVLIGRGTAAVEFATTGTANRPLLDAGAGANPAFTAIQTAITAWGLKKTPLSVFAAGTAYQLTNTPALLNFGTTDPSLTIDAAGQYLLIAWARIDYNAATFAANQTVTLKLRRTNNTAADLTNGSTQALTNIITTETETFGKFFIVIPYNTTNSDDVIEVWGDVGVVPGAGSIDAVEAGIVAIRLFDPTL